MGLDRNLAKSERNRAPRLALAALLCAAAAGCEAKHGEIAAFARSPEAQVAAAQYSVSPPDSLRIHAPQVPEIDGSLQTVRSDGKISLRLLGDVDVAGLTTAQIAEKLRGLLARFYIEPDVLVEISGQRSKQFYVFGEVQVPGPRPCTGRDSLLRTIAEARPTFLAWLNQVRVIRPGLKPEDRTVVIVDFDKILKKGDLGGDFLLQAGDIVEVPPTPLAWVGLRVRELLYPVSPVLEAYAAPANAIGTNNIYKSEFGSSDESKRSQFLPR
jgi:polysaccharide biosynthesis/export protein